VNVIGFSGGPDHIDSPPVAPGLSPLFFHDAAAALVSAGAVAFAVEEERLSRQKHSNAFPKAAIRACAAFAAQDNKDIDAFAFFFEEAFYDQSLRADCQALQLPEPPPVRQLLTCRLSQALEREIDTQDLHFVNHHRAHALSAWHACNFDHALILVIDGNGEQVSASLYEARHTDLVHLESHPVDASLGHFYRAATHLAGFRDFDEYKFMGLAPYGNAARLAHDVAPLLQTGSGGAYTLDRHGLDHIAKLHGVGRWTGDRPDQTTADFAAAIQGLLERAVLHILAPWTRRTGARSLCLAGGVAQNCVLNSRLAREGGFHAVFAYSAAFDAGAAIGAALAVGSPAKMPRDARRLIPGPFLGPDLESEEEILEAVAVMGPLCHAEPITDPAETAAEHLAVGEIIGFAQGRSEFGPRALGARSILADPRPIENWQRINLAVKQRESFRPFAPAALADDAADFFDLPAAGANHTDMTFTSHVLAGARKFLGAVTHVDGSARLQVVDRNTNPALYKLISAFRDRSGCPVVLNTSFNNSHEPIVQSAQDALRTFLTTELDALLIGKLLIRKTGERLADHLDQLRLRLDPWVQRVDCTSGETRLIRPSRQEVTIGRQHLACLLPKTGPTFQKPDLTGLSQTERSELALLAQTLWQKRIIDVQLAR
jgi:predicted NodU family carbamoyl transferase